MTSPLTNVTKLQEAFSLALEERSSGYQDLVANENALLYTMKKRGQFKPFSGPTIRERLKYNETGNYVRFSGYDYLKNTPAELFNDAEFTPKMAAIGVTLSGEQILQNNEPARLQDVMSLHIEAAETEMSDRFTEDLHSDGSADGGKQIGGLQLVIPTVTNAGTYGGISRVDNAIWRTYSYDANSDFSTIGTQVNSTTIMRIFDSIMYDRNRGRQYPDLILCSKEHYAAFAAATQSIQRITDENEMGALGFTSLQYNGSGKKVPVVLEGGIGSAMPANTTYFIYTKALTFRYDPARNFEAFGGKQRPINQDAIVQYVGFRGELTMSNPLFMAKLYDSNPAA